MRKSISLPLISVFTVRGSRNTVCEFFRHCDNVVSAKRKQP